jgi:glycine cleavage system H protein
VSWATREPEGTVLIGINDSFVRTMGRAGIELLPGAPSWCRAHPARPIQSADGLAHGVLCPVSGQVIETHAEVAAQPATVEKDPYGEGWLYRVLPSDLEYSFGAWPPGRCTRPIRGIRIEKENP